MAGEETSSCGPSLPISLPKVVICLKPPVTNTKFLSNTSQFRYAFGAPSSVLFNRPPYVGGKLDVLLKYADPSTTTPGVPVEICCINAGSTPVQLALLRSTYLAYTSAVITSPGITLIDLARPYCSLVSPLSRSEYPGLEPLV